MGDDLRFRGGIGHRLVAALRRSRFKVLSLTKGMIEFAGAGLLPVLQFAASYRNFHSGLLCRVIGLGIQHICPRCTDPESRECRRDNGRATALNYTKAQTWRSIILPQAVPPIIPVLGNLIVMFKETPILCAITLVEMMLTAKNIVSQSFRAFEPYTMVGILFLIISYIASLLVQRLENA